MVPSIGDQLRAKRQGAFVGRVRELAEFEGALASALADSRWPFQVVHLWGVGGIGKTTLLRQFSDRARRVGVPFLELDARHIAPNPQQFIGAWERLARVLPDSARAGQQCCVLAIDTYEALQPLDTWLRDRFLPTLPAACLVVLAGRHRPSSPWTTDVVWASLARALEMSSLSREDTGKLLAARSPTPSARDPERLDAVFRMTSGHPLAVALVAAEIEAVPDWLPTFESAGPAIIEGLVSRFLDEAPSPAHREALEIAALVMFTNQDLLADVMPHADAYALGRWLAGLAFMTSTEHGLAPHELAREAICGDLRRRSPDHMRHLRIQIYDSIARRASFDDPSGLPIRQLMYLLRSMPSLRPVVDVILRGNTWVEAATPADHAAVLALTARHEGEASARLLAKWLALQPDGLIIARCLSTAPGAAPEDGMSGFMFIARASADLPLDRLVPDDPAAQAFTRATQQHRFKAGEVALLARTWMSAVGYQRLVDPVPLAFFYHQVQKYLSTPGLALSATAYADMAGFRELSTFGDFPLLAGADYALGERHFGMYHRDWRTNSPFAWVSMMGRRDRSEPAAPRPTTASSMAKAGLLVGPEAAWFELTGEARVDLSTRKTLRSLLWRLVQTHRDAAGQATSLEAFQEIGWPGEQMSFHSGRQRVYVAVSTLRKLGLQAVLVSTEEGYLLPASLVIEIQGPSAAA